MSIWDQYPHYTDNELRMLVTLTAQALLESEAGIGEFPPDFLDVSPMAAAHQLVATLQDVRPEMSDQQVRKLLADDKVATELCLHILGEVRKYPELAARIAAAYEDSMHKLGVELVLLTGALVILAIKIKSIRWGEEGFKIDFYQSSDAIKTFISKLPLP